MPFLADRIRPFSARQPEQVAQHLRAGIRLVIYRQGIDRKPQRSAARSASTERVRIEAPQGRPLIGAQQTSSGQSPGKFKRSAKLPRGMPSGERFCFLNGV